MIEPLNIFYLHGLGSNGRGATVQRMKELGHQVTAIDYRPEQYVQSMELILHSFEPIQEEIDVVIGTSMGGYYAAKLSEKFAVKTLIVNPCFSPATHLKKYLTKPAINYSDGKEIIFAQGMLDSFDSIDANAIRNSGCEIHCLIGMNDDVINPDSVTYFCERIGIPYSQNEWGHRISDAATLIKTVRETLYQPIN